MKIFGLTLLLGICLLPFSGFAQINDCSEAQVVCDDSDLAFNPIGPGEDDFADPDNHPGCIVDLEQNSAWYYFQIDPNAPPDLILGFVIHPKGGYGEDYDWALFGPNVDCGDLGYPIRCSSASYACGFCPDTGMGMGATDYTEGPGTGDGFVSTLVVQPGQGFYLLIDNWQGTMNGFLLTWQGSAAPYLNCAANPPCSLSAKAGEDLVACEGDENIQLLGDSYGAHGNETYSWSGTNGGTNFLSDPNIKDPVINLPIGFSGTIIYTLTVTEDTCVGVDDLELTVNPLPEIEISETGPFCANHPPVVLMATPGGGTWSGDVSGNTFNPILNGPGLFTVNYSYTDFYGCTNESSLDIEVYDLPEIAVDPEPAVFCDNEAPVLLTATGSGGAGGYTYSWITPTETADGDTYGASISGLYTVVVTDDNGCSDTIVTNVVFNANPTVQIVDPGPICGNVDTDTLTAIPSGGAFSGNFISPSGVLHPSMIPPGSFQVSYTYEDANHCESTDFQTITILQAPVADATNNGPLCEGDSLLLFGMSDTTGASVMYAWTGPSGYTSSLQNPNNATQGGIYTFQVILGSCTSKLDTTIVNLSPRPDATAQNGGPYCGIQTVDLSGSTTSTDTTIIFEWTGPNGFMSDEQNPSDTLSPGLYSLIVNDNGCQSLPATTLVTINPVPQPVISGQHVFCTGFSSTLDAGPGYTAYLWNDGSTNQKLDASFSGIYQVTVTDMNGCTGAASFDVMEQPSLSPVITGALEFCEGSGTILDAGSGYTSYTWSTGATSETISVTDGSNYAVVVTDATGCNGSANVTTIEHPTPNVMIGGSTTYCIGGFTIIDAGTGYSSYQWNDNSTDQTLTVSTPGTYAVSVIDPFGCTGADSVMVDESTSLHPVVTGNYAFCQGGNTILNAGTGFATYVWSDGSTNQTLTVNTPGNYWVSVSDGQGCDGADTVSVAEVLPPFAQVQTTTTLCNTTAGGSVLNLYDLVLAGDINGTWQDIDNSGAVGLFNHLDFKGIAAGDYRFVYTTNSAVTPCPEETYQVVVTVMYCTCPDVFFLNTAPLCNGGDALDLTTVENTTESGTWSMIQTPPGTNPGRLIGNIFDATGGDPGQYTFQFSLQNQPPPGCPLDYQVMINVDAAVRAGSSGFPEAFCFNEDRIVSLPDLIIGADANGSWSEISAMPSQGNAFDANSGTFKTLNQLPGIYIFKYLVESHGACPDDSVQVSVVINPLPTVMIAPAAQIDCIHPIQVLDATGSSSGAGFDIRWTGPGLVINGNENTLQPTVNKGGTYDLIVTNTNTGCKNTAAIIVLGNTDAPRGVIVDAREPSCYGDADGSIHINQVTGGVPPYQFSLNNGPLSNNNVFDHLTAGNYSLGIEDSHGCRWDSLVVLDTPMEIALDLGPDIEIDLGQDATVQASINLMANQIDTFFWTPENLVECFDPVCLEGTVHTFNTVTLSATVVAISGCKVTDQITITVNKNRKLYIPNVFSPNDDGINDRFIVYGDEHQISDIRKFMVFNRWGDELFEATDFQPNDPAHGWDGHFRNEAVNPGVYVYSAEVEYIDGVVEVVTGDVTVVK